MVDGLLILPGTDGGAEEITPMSNPDRVIVFGKLPAGNYPFLALPRPGTRPFVVRRDRFIQIIKSLDGREITWEIVTEPQRTEHDEEIRGQGEYGPNQLLGYKSTVIEGPEREKLVIQHRNGHGRGVVKFYNVLENGSYPLQQQCDQWLTETMRANGRCPCYEFARRGSCEHTRTRERREVMKSLSPRQRQIMKLEESRDGIRLNRPGAPWQVDGPRCVICDEWPAYHEREWNKECPGYVPGTYYTATEREYWLRWMRQRGLRREIMRRVRAWQASVDKSTAKLYRIVEDIKTGDTDGAGVTVKRWSKMHVGEKRHFDDDFGVYLKRLWESCGLVSKPNQVERSWPEWGPDRYKCWIGNLHRRKELQGMIDGLIAEDRG